MVPENQRRGHAGRPLPGALPAAGPRNAACGGSRSWLLDRRWSRYHAALPGEERKRWRKHVEPLEQYVSADRYGAPVLPPSMVVRALTA